MQFDIFKKRPDAHIRRAQEYLQQAHLARIEHQIAAEHHGALAAMYAKRANWLEREVAQAMTGNVAPPRPAAPKVIETVRRVSDSILALPRHPRASENGA